MNFIQFDVNKPGHNGQYFEQPSYGTNHDLQLESNLQSQLGAAQQAGHVLFQSLGTTEKELIDNNIVVMPGSASAAHSLFFHTTHETQKINLESLVDVYTAQELVKRWAIILLVAFDTKTLSFV